MNSIVASAMRATASLTMAAAMVAFADPALAASPFEAVNAQAIVQTSDLDLSSSSGRAVADHRIQAAAREVCSSDEYDRIAQQSCTNKAVADARQALHREMAGTVVLASN